MQNSLLLYFRLSISDDVNYFIAISSHREKTDLTPIVGNGFEIENK